MKYYMGIFSGQITDSVIDHVISILKYKTLAGRSFILIMNKRKKCPIYG